DSIAEKIQVTNDGEVVLNDEVESIDHSYVLVVGTTSRPDSVDGGLRRAGRFDCEISLGIPDERARDENSSNCVQTYSGRRRELENDCAINTRICWGRSKRFGQRSR
ncbi:hypothetical protein KIN20_006553, partial [Parelaphostrongylus tenuis]